MRIPVGDCCTGEDRFYGDNRNEDPVVTDMVMPGQEHGFDPLSVKPPLCKNLLPDVSQWTWSARRGSCRQFWRIFAFNLLQLCIAGCVQCISIDWWALRISGFSLSVSLFPLELWWRPMLLSSWPRLKRRFRPQYFNSTFPLVLDEDSRWGLLHRRRSLLWWQRERGPSRDGHGDAWADEHFRLALETQKRPPPFEAVGLVDKDLQFVVNESELQHKAFVCVNFISIWSTGWKNLFPDVSQWTWSARRGYCGQFWRIFAFNLLQLCIAGCAQWILVDLVSTFAFPRFLFQFLYFRLSCDAPKQMATPDEAFQTSAVQVNFSTRFGWGFPSGTAAQEKIASMVTTWTRWCLGKSMDLISFPWSHQELASRCLAVSLEC